MLWGIEREALRLNTESQSVSLAETALSFSSNHKLQGKIVGDFSDTQVELITYPRRSWEEALEDLQQLHLQFYLEHPQEQLWPHSLPPQGALREWKDPGLSPLGFSSQNRHQDETEYRRHLRKHYPLRTLLTSGIHLNIGLENERLFPLARRLWSEMGLWAYLFGRSPSQEARLSTRLSARGYRNTLCCTGYPLLMGITRYQEDLDQLLKHWSRFRLKRASELYAPIRIKRSCSESAEFAGIPEGTAYLEIRLIDLQGGPWGLEGHHLMMAEYLLEFALHRGDLPQWNEKIQEQYLHRLDQVAESGKLSDTGIDTEKWIRDGEKFISARSNHPRFSSLLKGWELINRRLRKSQALTPLALSTSSPQIELSRTHAL